jgi:hypothetical protein
VAEEAHSPHFPIVEPLSADYIFPVNRLTRQEQMVLCIVVGLLLTGWAVKIYRAAHPPAAAVEAVRP